MESEYIIIPEQISNRDLFIKKSLSASDYQSLDMHNKQTS